MKERGFTLIEILLVVGLLAVLMVFLFPRGARTQAVALESTAQQISMEVMQAINNRLLQRPSMRAIDVVSELGLKPGTQGLPSLYKRYPGGNLYDCTGGAYLNDAVKWSPAPPGVRCTIDVAKDGETFRVITDVVERRKSYYVNGELVTK